MPGFSLTRLQSDGVGTRSVIASGGDVICEALELALHAPKIAGKTRIPVGEYPLGFHGASKFDAVYRKRLENDGQVYRGMIDIRDVPDFADVLFHCGNTTADSEGCVLCGECVVQTPNGFVIRGGESESAYLRLYRAMSAAIVSGGASLTVLDEDR
jgi:Family of unknown function (DUF5675)